MTTGKITRKIITSSSSSNSPREIGEHVFAAETVDPQLLRYERAVLAEYVVPRVEQHVPFDVDHGQVSIGLVHDRLQIVEPRGQERLERPVEPGPLGLTVTGVVHALDAVHVARVRFVQRRHPQLLPDKNRNEKLISIHYMQTAHYNNPPFYEFVEKEIVQ